MTAMIEQQVPEVLAHLNEDQLKPAMHLKGPIFCIAGPGSGKTNTIISRAAYMIESGINPHNILMFTFTKKAANELKNRIQAKVGKQAIDVTVGTYHSFCSRLLKKYATYIGYETNFSIYDTSDQKNLLKEIMKGSEDIKPDYVLKRISDWKNKLITPQRAAELAEDLFDELSASFYKQYQVKLKEQNAVDFDDLIVLVIRLLSKHPQVKREVNKQYTYLFCDETQDSSPRDLELIELLAGKEENVCMIADDDQSIYSFRGADLDAVLSLKARFANLTTYILRQNYRSTKNIVNAARSMIVNNENQVKKELFTNNPEGDKVLEIESKNQYQEASFITSIIKKFVKEGKYKRSDIAILYRMSYLSRAFEDQFLKNSIPYEVVGGTPFYARQEIKDIMCYVRFVYNQKDLEAFKRIINVPKRGIGEKSVKNIIDFTKENHHDSINIIESCLKAELRGKAKKQAAIFAELISGFIEYSEYSEPQELVQKIIKQTNYLESIKEDEKFDEKSANLEELLSIASQYETIDDFIYNMTLNSDNSEEDSEEQDKVQLLTMHASKGLEFKVVFAVGLNEGTCPSWRAETPKAIDEERRILYVAMTRAEELLVLTRANSAVMGGFPKPTEPSRFLSEVNSEYIQKIK